MKLKTKKITKNKSANPNLSNGNQINSGCRACQLNQTARAVCLRGRNSDRRRPLMVFVDHPDYFADNAKRSFALDSGKILDWMFRRMSVDPDGISYEYTVRCYPRDTLPSTKADRAVCIEECAQYRFATIAKVKPKSIVVLGNVSLEAFTGKSQIGQWVERKLRCWEPVVRDFVEEVWVGYSLNYILTSPSDTPSVFRVLFQGARDAGLNPEINPSTPPFQWRDSVY